MRITPALMLATAFIAAACGLRKDDTADSGGLPPEPLHVDCIDGYGFGSPVTLNDGRIAVHGGGYNGLGGTAMVSADSGATFDRIPLLVEHGPWVAGDVLFYEGWTLHPGADPHALLPDGTLIEAEVSESPGSEVSGATKLWKAGEHWLAEWDNGWVRHSHDAGTTWETVDGGRFRVTNEGAAFHGERALVPGPNGTGQYTQDGGETWQNFPFAPYQGTREVELFGESSMLYDGEPYEVSHDHGVTWTNTGVMGWPWFIGPGPEEIWVALQDRFAQAPLGTLTTSDDGGRTWHDVELTAGEHGPIGVLQLRGVVANANGERVFFFKPDPETVDSAAELMCTETSGPGSLTTVMDHANTSDDREAVAWWTASSAVPMPQRGATAHYTGHWNNAVDTSPWLTDYHRDPVWVDRTAEGDLLVLLRPEESLDAQYGPPMRMLKLDGTDANTITGGWSFNNLKSGAGLNDPLLFLEAERFEMLPDGRVFMQTDDGAYDVTKELGRQRPFPGKKGRWGLLAGEVTYLHMPERFPMGSWLQWMDEVPNGPGPNCLKEVGEVPDLGCVPPYMGAPVIDYAVLDGNIYAIDSLRGTVVKHSMLVSEPDSPWNTAIEGLQQPTDLYVDVETADPALYVYDSAGWWRIVPGSGNPIRPR